MSFVQHQCIGIKNGETVAFISLSFECNSKFDFQLMCITCL